jgi:hypothetical protein
LASSLIRVSNHTKKRKSTFDEVDSQIDVSDVDSSLSSCRQSSSPGPMPDATGLVVVSFVPAKNVENMLIRFPREVGLVTVVRDIIVMKFLRKG